MPFIVIGPITLIFKGFFEVAWLTCLAARCCVKKIDTSVSYGT